MARSVTAKVEGLDKAKQALAGLPAAIRTGGERAVVDELDELARDMRDNAPVGDARWGRRGDPPLSESIVTTTEGLTGTAGPRAPHAPFVEFGTSSRPAKPFVGPAAERARSRFPQRVATEVREALP
jgi:HK97 gp10 family phage protein